MIARVHVPDDDGGYTLELDESGRWHCPEFPEVAEAFTRLHAGTFQEWNGRAGAWQAHDAARRLKGEVIEP